MRDLTKDFNKNAEVEKQKREQDIKKLDKDKQNDLQRMLQENAQSEARIDAQNAASHAARVQAESIRIQKLQDQKARALKPSWAPPSPARTQEQLLEMAKSHREEAARNIELRDKQQKSERATAFERRFSNYLKTALEEKNNAKSETPSKDELMQKDMAKWRKSARDDFDRER